MTRVLAVAALLVAGGIYVLITYALKIEDAEQKFLIGLGLMLSIWTVVELAVARHLRRNKRLERFP